MEFDDLLCIIRIKVMFDFVFGSLVIIGYVLGYYVVVG